MTKSEYDEITIVIAEKCIDGKYKIALDLLNSFKHELTNSEYNFLLSYIRNSVKQIKDEEC